jgi:hypothetical protein
MGFELIGSEKRICFLQLLSPRDSAQDFQNANRRPVRAARAEKSSI